MILNIVVPIFVGLVAVYCGYFLRRYIAENMFPLSGEIIMYGDSKISITNFTKNQVTGIVVDDTALHQMMRNIFELSWNSSLVKE